MKRYIVGILIAIALIAWLLSRLDLSKLGDALWSARIEWLLSLQLLRFLQHYLKARRWGFIIHRAVPQTRPTHLFSATMIGFTGNIIFPARLGELLRVEVFQKNNPSTSRSLALTCSVLAQLFDLFIVLCLFVVALTVSHDGRVSYLTVMLAMSVVLAIFLSLFLFQRYFDLLQSKSRIFQRFVPLRGQLLLSGIFYEIRQALCILQSARDILFLFGWTVVIWTLEITFLIGLMYAFHLPLHWGAILLLTSSLSLAFILPITPGNVGTHQIISIWVLSRFAVSQEHAMAASIGIQSLEIISICAAGLIFLSLEGLHLRQLKSPASSAALDLPPEPSQSTQDPSGKIPPDHDRK